MTGPVFRRNGEVVETRFGALMPPDAGWLGRGVKEVVLEPELPIVDPHHHLWIRPGDQYLVSEFAEDVNTGHNIVATIYANCQAMYRAHGPDHLRVVGETEFVVGQAAQSASGIYGKTKIANVMFGYADVRLGQGIREVLEAHNEASNGRFRGIRFLCNFDHHEEIRNGAVAVNHDMLRDSTVKAAINVLSDMGLTLDLYVFFHQLDQVAEIAEANPNLTIVLNHCGGPLTYGPYREDDLEIVRTWTKGMTAIARYPNVFCKLGGLINRTTAYDYRKYDAPPPSVALAGMWRRWIEPCVELMGAHRCMFESNFPPDKMGISYAVMWNTFKILARSSSANEKMSLFSGAAMRAYRFSL